MNTDAASKPKPSLKGILIFFGILLLVGLASVYVPVRNWQNEQVYHKTRSAIARGDVDLARHYLQVLNQRLPERERTLRLQGDLELFENDPMALRSRRELVAKYPGAENRSAFGLALLHFNELETANTLYRTWPADERNELGFAIFGGALNYSTGNVGQALIHFAEARRLDPANPHHAINNAAIQIAIGSESDQTYAFQTLTRALETREGGNAAARVLLEAGIQQQNPDYLRVAATALWTDPGAVAPMKTAALKAIASAPDFEWEAWLDDIDTAGTLSLEDRNRILLEMLESDRETHAFNWTQSWDPVLRDAEPLQVTYSELLRRNDRISLLMQQLQKDTWGEKEYLRQAYMGYAFDRSQFASAQTRARNSFERACEEALESEEKTLVLASLYNDWGMEAASRNLLQAAAAEGFSGPNWEGLEILHFETFHDEAFLYSRLRVRYQQRPGDLLTRNNLAALATSLGTDRELARKLAKENLQAHPRNPDIVATYALTRISDDPEAVLDVVAPLLRAHPDHPGLRFYYGQAHRLLGRTNPFAAETTQLVQSGQWTDLEREWLEGWASDPTRLELASYQN
mgnify:FL=1